MSDFDLVAPRGANKKKRIVGRGSSSGRGTTSGRGNKGQQSRSGGKSYVGFEGGQMPLYRRVAKKGFSNYPFKKEYIIFNLSVLEKAFKDGETVSLETLCQKGLIKNTKANVKILGDGELSKKLTVDIQKVSKSARSKIRSAGGDVADVASGDKN